MKKKSIGFVNVDMPQLAGLMPHTNEVTSALAYFRFHGRNKAKWWHHGQAYERYDYAYRKEELQEWVPAIKESGRKASKAYVFFNNHYQGKAVSSAILLGKLLDIRMGARMQEREKGLGNF